MGRDRRFLGFYRPNSVEEEQSSFESGDALPIWILDTVEMGMVKAGSSGKAQDPFNVALEILESK